MYAAIRHVKVTSADEARQRITGDFLPNTLQKLPGFQAFYFLKLSDQEFYSITIYDTADQAEESNRRAAAWARQSSSDILISGPDTSVAEVSMSRTAKPGEFPGQMAA